MDAVERRHVLALEQPRDLLVGEDHQLLDQAVGLGLDERVRGLDVAVGRERELRLGAPHLEAGGVGVGNRRRRPPSRRDRIRDRVGGALGPGEDPVEVVVVEARVGTDPRPVEARRASLRRFAELDLGGHREPLDAGVEAARVAAQRRGQHRADGAGRIGGVRPLERLAVEPALRLHVGGDVGDVDPDPEAVALGSGRDGVVEVAGAGGIDREGRLGGQVATPAGVALEAGDGAPRLLLVTIPERRAQPAVGDQRGDDVAGVVGAAEVDDRLAAAMIDPAERDPARRDLDAASGEAHLRAALEQRLADPEARHGERRRARAGARDRRVRASVARQLGGDLIEPRVEHRVAVARVLVDDPLDRGRPPCRGSTCRLRSGTRRP